MDTEAFRQFASSTRVVASLSLHYGLAPSHHTSAFDKPCVSTGYDHPSYGTAAFLYFADVDLWDCFPGESVFSIAPIFQAGCACHGRSGSRRGVWRVGGGGCAFAVETKAVDRSSSGEGPSHES